MIDLRTIGFADTPIALLHEVLRGSSVARLAGREPTATEVYFYTLAALQRNFYKRQRRSVLAGFRTVAC